VQNIAPEAIRSGKYRFLRTAPVIFSPLDPRFLYFAGNVLFKTTDGGNRWEVISPDLSRDKWDVPKNVGVYTSPDMATMPRRGVIYTVAPSFKDVNTIWAGTDDGLIHITRDGGKNWANITPPDLPSWAKVSLLEASHFDNDTAYAAINTFRLDDLRPHIYRTHDGGKSWKEITRGLPNGGIVNAVREDPLRKGLLFAGTEQAVYVSFDDGENWQSLRLNMPATSIRDLVVHNDDIVVGTHGRSFWILDDITPLRQINSEVAASEAFLFQPQLTYRVRRSLNTDTPIPPEEPMGQNPPDGAILNYYLKADSAQPVSLSILDSAGGTMRTFSSKDEPEVVNEKELAYPNYWFRPSRTLSAKAGMHRWVWDMHHAPPAGSPRTYGMQAIYQDTPTGPLGPGVLPGEYTVILSVNGKTYKRTLTIKMDPRVKTPPEGIRQQYLFSIAAYEKLRQIRETLGQIRELRRQLAALKASSAQGALADAIAALDRKVAALEGTGGGRGGGGEPSFARLSGEFNSLMALAEGADVQPTTQAQAALGQAQQTFAGLNARWLDLKDKDVKALNEQLGRAKLPLIQ
jgi:hypothetical protein